VLSPASARWCSLDEIDKAEPDVPNDLLVPLGSHEFRVQEPELEVVIKSDAPAGTPGAPLVIITTNRERELPPHSSAGASASTFALQNLTISSRLRHSVAETTPNAWRSISCWRN
jgi:hypothetical protein